MAQLRASAKDEILSRIKNALRDVPDDEKPEQLVIERHYRQQSAEPQTEIVKLFINRLEDYNAGVHQIKETEIAATVADLCQKYALDRLVMATDVPQEWVPEGVEAWRDEQQTPLTNEQIGESNSAVLTGCALAIAQTGTIVLDGGTAQGRRALSLLPDYAFCVVHEEQIVGLVTEGIRRLEEAAIQRHQLVTFISGPSATSDIELSRVVGVHGPRHLDVLII
jgi:L-lactate dehydrogenase complex protein LldG